MPDSRDRIRNKQASSISVAESLPHSGIARELPPGWTLPRPERLPEPTYNPVIFALGIIFLAMGVVSSYYIAVVGAVLFVIGLARWIGELQHDARSDR